MYVVKWGVNNRIIVFCPISNIDKTTTPNASIYLDRVVTRFQSCVGLWSFLLYQQPQAVINEPQKLVPRCQNPIFTPEIFSGVGTQNETAPTEPGRPDRGPPHQKNLKTGSGAHFPEFGEV
jgi:hypothetical protein